jgi:hypothetical protein
MKKRFAIPLIAVAFVATAFVVAIGFLASRRWFGVGDLYSFSFWSLLLSIPIVGLALILGRQLARLSTGVGFGLAVVLGAILGYLSTMAVWMMLGAWFGAFSFPVFYCWLAGAIAACVTATKFARKKVPIQPPEPTAPSGRGSA